MVLLEIYVSITPYDNYNLIYFNIPTHLKGDCWARFILRVEEMYESLLIIEQALELVTSYHLNKELHYLIRPLTDYFKFNVPSKENSSISMEELIHEFRMNSEGYSVLKNKSYQAIESPKGEFGITLVSQDKKKTRPVRLKVKAPGFNHLQSYNTVTTGCLLTDALTILGSFDVVLGEIDR